MAQIFDGDINDYYIQMGLVGFFRFYVKDLREDIYTDHKHNFTMKICIIPVK